MKMMKIALLNGNARRDEAQTDAFQRRLTVCEAG